MVESKESNIKCQTTEHGVCATCGFLALRNRITLQLDESPYSYRTTGKVPLPQLKTNEPGPANQPYPSLPTCFAMATSLEKEIAFGSYPTDECSETLLQDAISAYERNMSLDKSQFDKLAAILNRQNRHCSEWRKWQQGFTPKEHREMMDRERERRWHIIEIIIITIIGLIASIGAAIVGALIATGKIG